MENSVNISVVIPCYNAEAFLGETIHSILKQSWLPQEILVVDDGSTDDSAEVAAVFGEPVRVIRQSNQGESVARNRGLDEARGEWTALLDSDDIWLPGKLESQFRALAASDSKAICLYTDCFVYRNGQRLHDLRYPDHHLEADFVAPMLGSATVHPSSSVVQTKIAREIRFPEETQDAEDMIFFANLRRRGSFLHIPMPLTGYRIRGNNQSRRPDHSLRAVKSCLAWFERHASLYPEHSRPLVRERLLRKLVEAHEVAYWTRENRVVKECRIAFQQLFSDFPLPPSFSRRLYPSWLMRWKDRMDGRSGDLDASTSAASGPVNS